jgi:peptide/nickel transport system substrate-binding protein
VDVYEESVIDAAITREELLRGTVGAALALGLGGTIVDLAQGAAQATPNRGGRLRVAEVGAGKSENFNPARGSNFIDAARYLNTYDPLVRVKPDLSFAPGLALSWTPNGNSTVWVVKLRKGVTFHNGKSFTADDVIYTLRSMGDPKHVGHAKVLDIRLGDLKKIDPYTLRIPLKTPNARLYDNFATQNTVVIPNGLKDFTKPVGTGPFAYGSFTPGVRSLSTRNPDYWESGKPYVDELEIVSIDDPGARLNALLGGKVDAASQMQPAQARVHQKGGRVNVLVAPSTTIQVFLMATDIAPFNDNRVRQAFRLIPDRQKLIDGALAGFGTVANDLAGKGLPNFATFPARKHDPERAKSQLAKAGQADLTVTLQTAPVTSGIVEAATLFAQQAKQAGVDMKVKQEPAGAYFDTSLLYTKMAFAQSYWTVLSLSQWYTESLLSTAVWNETHYRKKSYDTLIRSAIGAPTVATSRARWRDVQAVQYREGGYIVWTNLSLIDGLAKDVQGAKPSAFFPIGGYNFRDLWLA